MSDTVIKIENLSKQYRLGTIGSQTLRGDLQRRWYKMKGKEADLLKIGDENKLSAAGGQYVWALRDINLQIGQGEIVGIIGKNGAGKSTLLKILSRVTGPTTGQIKIKGHIAGLLEVGTGFHPELTGRENIFLNGAILGMTKSEIKKKLDEIVDFAGVAKYLDTPVKRYSSGMHVRLGFAVAAHLEPDILIVDEVLAVGDAEFQKKAIGKMQDVSRGEGRTVLFVSHNMTSIEQLCTRGVVLHNGALTYDDTAERAISHYLGKTSLHHGKAYRNTQPESSGDILKIAPEDINGKEKFSFTIQEEIYIAFDLIISERYLHATLSCRIKDKQERNICTTEVRLSEFITQPGKVQLRTKIPARFLSPNAYSIVAILHIVNQEMICLKDSLTGFEVSELGNPFYQYSGVDSGCVLIPNIWQRNSQDD